MCGGGVMSLSPPYWRVVVGGSKRAVPYRIGGPETTAGKAPDGKCTPTPEPQAFFKSAVLETTAGKTPDALRINAVNSLNPVFIQMIAVFVFKV